MSGETEENQEEREDSRYLGLDSKHYLPRTSPEIYPYINLPGFIALY
jgi:hypothetical protein